MLTELDRLARSVPGPTVDELTVRGVRLDLGAKERDDRAGRSSTPSSRPAIAIRTGP